MGPVQSQAWLATPQIYAKTSARCRYQNYPDWLQITAGVIVLGSMFTSLVVFFVYPEFWDRFGMMDQDQASAVAYFPHVRPVMLSSWVAMHGSGPTLCLVVCSKLRGATCESCIVVYGFDLSECGKLAH